MMRRPLLILLLGLSALLLMCIVWELTGYFAATDQPADSAAPVLPGPGTSPAVPDGNAALYVATILARPLFALDRKPVADKSRGPVEIGSDHPVDLPRLSGILMTGTTGRAIFQPIDGSKPVTLGPGETIAGWTILTIDLAGVTMAGPGGTRLITPASDPSLTPPQTGAAPNAVNPFTPPLQNRIPNIPRGNAPIIAPNSIPTNPRVGRSTGKGVSN